MICHTDAVAGNRTSRDTDDEEADGDEDHGARLRRVRVDDNRMRGSLLSGEKARTNKGARWCRVASFCPAGRSNVLVDGLLLPGCGPFTNSFTDSRVSCVEQQPVERTKARRPARRNLRTSNAYPCCRGQPVRLPGVG